MGVKDRVKRLEDSHAAQGNQQVIAEDDERAHQWLNDTIREISEGTHKRDPWIIRPVPPGAGHTKAWLHNTLNEIAEIKQNELKESQVLVDTV